MENANFCINLLGLGFFGIPGPGRGGGGASKAPSP